MNQYNNDFWTPERIAELRRLHATDMPYLEIAQQLGTTKNAISGKVFRLRMNMRKPSTAPITTVSQRLEALNVFPRRGCVFPIGHPREDGFHFCGDDVELGEPYCQTHHRTCFGRVSEAFKIKDAA